MKKHILIAILCLAMFETKAQQVASYAQYLFNGLAINPAYAGSHDMLSFSALSRFQNSGVDGAPNTQTMALHTPLWNKSFAVGLLAIRDEIGIINQTGIHGIAAYRIFMDGSGEKYLSFGLQFGNISYRANYSDLEILNPDPVFAENIRQSRPNFGAGIYYRTTKYYIGISLPHLASNVFDRGPDFQTIHQPIPLLVSGGYLFYISTGLQLKPNFFFEVVDGRFAQLDLNASVLIDHLLWVGASYRLPRGLNLLTEFHITEQLLFGYSYTVARNLNRSAEIGSHELLINYRFNYFKSGLISPRFF